jgi:hypothetical protein
MDSKIRIAFALTSCMVFFLNCRELPPYECPPGRDPFCDADDGTPGRCLMAPDGKYYCARPANDCSSMLRWSVIAGEPYADECVDPALIPKDAGADGPSVDGGTDGAAGGG